MKNFKILKRVALAVTALTLMLALALSLFACAAASNKPGLNDGKGGGAEAGGEAGDARTPSVDGGEYSVTPSAPGGSGKTGGSGGDGKTPQAGQLTAAEWNDIKNYSFWRSLIAQSSGTDKTDAGIFYNYMYKWGLYGGQMIPVSVKNSDGKPVRGCSVELQDEQHGVIFSAQTNAQGMAYLFPQTPFESGFIFVDYGPFADGNPVPYTYSASHAPVEFVRDFNAAVARLQLMLVLDTTGSMGDEIAYLKSELADVIARVEAGAGVEIELAILLYKDIGDVYVTQYYDFTNDIASQQTVLSKATASGGGDFPEAVDRALSEAIAKQWSESPQTARVILHVLDAPPHDNAENIALYKQSILGAAKNGIAVIPVASSGIDKETEFLLRSEALLTGGRYVFITDNSGIGGSHIEATVGDHTVELLNSLLTRLILEFITGEKTPAIDWKQAQ